MLKKNQPTFAPSGTTTFLVLPKIKVNGKEAEPFWWQKSDLGARGGTLQVSD